MAAAAIRGARERARAELTREIKREARRQLARDGAQRLSLRAVARELGMASSALYRYFPSRDELLTALIADARSELAEAVERAVAVVGGGVPGGDSRVRWRAYCSALRDWARARPHEYALLYGSPVPGYQAPAEALAPAARIPLAVLGVLRATAPGPAQAAGGPQPPALSAPLARLAAQQAPELPQGVAARAVSAWTQLCGLVGFELFGQLDGMLESNDAFFAQAVEQLADFLGLPPQA
ncbi:TetR/AcrR family transcriptional regulator [Kitasatospora sp. GAS1066B]|uniref:TetR/AcrR family transcriptional regulator n=1 Tax=Kitasatospora sp. GAS1066B TaxID=3156271 RepID=UPI0035112326